MVQGQGFSTNSWNPVSHRYTESSHLFAPKVVRLWHELHERGRCPNNSRVAEGKWLSAILAHGHGILCYRVPMRLLAIPAAPT